MGDIDQFYLIDDWWVWLDLNFGLVVMGVFRVIGSLCDCENEYNCVGVEVFELDLIS